MEILNQQWFWAGTFSVISVIIGSLLTMCANYLKEKSNRSTQIRIEKLKLYDERKFQAYLDLYNFISQAYSFYWPPDDLRQDFIAVMKNHFFKQVKVHYPFFEKEIRKKIKILESQYECLRDPDFSPNIPFDRFIKDEYLKLLNELNSIVENVFDEWEKK